MKTVAQVSALTGLSVRTLHYYDQIGLLHPAQVTDAGYRLYDAQNLMTLQQILFYREMGFPLKEIRSIILNPAFDKTKALLGHRKVLYMKRERLDQLISHVDSLLEGDETMNFKAFDETEIQEIQKQYEQEVQKKWGDTKEFQQSRQKSKHYTKEDWQKITEEQNQIFAEFAAQMEQDPKSIEVQKTVARWQNYISAHYYECTNSILASLGQMYIQDERFKANIDNVKNGLAQFMHDAIQHYCNQ